MFFTLDKGKGGLFMLNWCKQHWKRTILIVVLLCVIIAPTWSGKMASKVISFVGAQVDSFTRASLGDKKTEGFYEFFRNGETTEEEDIVLP